MKIFTRISERYANAGARALARNTRAWDYRSRYNARNILAINYSRVMSVRPRGIVWAAFAGNGKEIPRVRSFYRRRAFPPGCAGRGLRGPRSAAADAQILRERFYAEICGFIGNSYEGGGPCAFRADPARKLDELRTVVRNLRAPARCGFIATNDPRPFARVQPRDAAR